MYFSMFTCFRYILAVNHTQLQYGSPSPKTALAGEEDGYLKKKKNQEKKPGKIVPKRHLLKKKITNNYETQSISTRLWRCLKISINLCSTSKSMLALLQLPSIVMV